MAFNAITLTRITAYDKICNKVPSKFLKELHNESKEVSMKPKKKPICRLHLGTSPKPGTAFPTSFSWSWLYSVSLVNMIVRFDDNGGIADHHRLNFLFIIKCYYIKYTKVSVFCRLHILNWYFIEYVNATLSPCMLAIQNSSL